jgi:flagellar secretion chaperone FliS
MQTTNVVQYKVVQYLEAEVLGADPLKLVSLLYRGASEAVAAARRHLAARQIAQRSQQINRAWAILFELLQSLDRKRGGELVTRLAGLYTYMQQRLIEANLQQTDAPLAEVEQLLATLGEAWQSIQQGPAGAGVPDANRHAEDYRPVSCSY